MKLKALTLIATAGIAIAALACSGDDGGSDDDGGSGSGSGSSESTGSSSNCATDWECINGACECKTSGKEGNSCCDPDECDDSSNCDAACEVCN